MSTAPVEPIMTGAPKGSYTTGYAFWMPITATPPSDAHTPIADGANLIGLIGEEGVTLTSEIESDMKKDWNLDDVLQINQGSSSSVTHDVFGFNKTQAALLYGQDSVVENADGTWRLVFTGELPPHIYLVYELHGQEGHARLVAEAQLSNPGEVSFVKSDALTHTLEANLFKNPLFKDAKDRDGYYALHFGQPTQAGE